MRIVEVVFCLLSARKEESPLMLTVCRMDGTEIEIPKSSPPLGNKGPRGHAPWYGRAFEAGSFEQPLDFTFFLGSNYFFVRQDFNTVRKII